MGAEEWPERSARMTMTADVARIFADARLMHSAALTQMDAGDLRDAAEKAWCATKRAADALLLARTGEVPETTTLTSRGLRHLSEEDEAVEPLVGRYYTRINHLHGECFYMGMCEPLNQTIRRIRETEAFILDAERLADR